MQSLIFNVWQNNNVFARNSSSKSCHPYRYNIFKESTFPNLEEKYIPSNLLQCGVSLHDSVL
jgi:hypothetical protein